ncbi:DUF2510 domain-containing protein [Streptomyces sp. NPDC087512]|uniref:DUF2510 domain-containing protein n=1 Tax=Streptomyces sp. NPDC087512 TaxID=3155059 RepID=UPI00341EB069
MTQVTPPGWYPDPGQKSDGPATERWWDGKAWTDQVRAAGPAAAWAPPTPPAAGAPDGAVPGGPDGAVPGDPGGAVPGPVGAVPAAGGGAAGAYGGAPGPAGAVPGPTGVVPGAYAAPGPYPVHPGYPGYPVQPPPGRRRGLRTAIAVAATVAVLAGIGAGVYVLTGDDSNGGSSASRQQEQREEGPGSGSGPDGASPAPDGPGRSQPPRIDSGSVPDPVSGISLPIPDGWSGQQLSVGATVTSDDSYKCPGDASATCTKGGAYSAPAIVLDTKGTTAEEVAKADIEANAEESYGGASYGGITSHEELASEAVTVAGQKGYLVRWKAVTSKGSDGYVESLAFPSPADAKRIVVVRIGVDVEEGQTVLDEITKGIAVSSGGGSGQDV